MTGDPVKDRLLECVRVGVAMREAQKQYFKTRNQAALATSKALERQFDDLARFASNAAGDLFSHD